MRNDKTRPLLQGVNIKQKLEQLYAKRNPIYEGLADYIVDTGAQSAMEISHHIEQLLKCNQAKIGAKIEPLKENPSSGV